MRIFSASIFGMALIMTSAAVAKPQVPHGARTVQLLSMPARGTPKSDGPSEQLTLPPPVTPSGEAAPDFRVHDLSRQWVAFQMANSLTGTASEGAENQEQDPFAQVGVAQPDLASGVAVMGPPVAVPAWMTGASSYQSEALRYAPGCGGAPYRPTGFLRWDAEGRRRNYYGMMSDIACEFGIPIGLFDAMIIRESQYQPFVFSSKNAFGLTQLMPATAIALGVNRYSVEGNLRGGARYLRQQLDRFGQYHLALAAYNAGPGRVRAGRVPAIAETQDYVVNVLRYWSRLSASSRAALVLRAGAERQVLPQIPGRSASVAVY